ncbi:hypothetical protein RHD99_21870 [Buttiauxella selenatireducens]|uniref:TIGR02270 family protein n=1 Tax=Buttiauxella selenatireducens TaxID=3073902 RepID=A0ABY9S960_9ENTR|nr:hypothetical protein [Buttiauxella sp. R73]WMY74043.1 hypothetical protein RHD99_21870 [Buttiauxella sp. R73]
MLALRLRHLLAEQYTDMLAQDFRLRSVLLSSHCHTLSDLTWFDLRMQTYQEGMILLKEQTSDYLSRQIREPLSAGELFSVALFAANANDEFLLSGCLGMAQALPHLFSPLCSAINWMPGRSNVWPQILSLPACRAYTAAIRNDQPASVMFSQQEVQMLIEQDKCVDYLLQTLCRSASPLFIPALETLFSSGQEELILQGCQAVLCSDSLPNEYTIAATRNLHLLTRSKKTNIRTFAVKYLLTHTRGVSHSLVSDLLEEGNDTRLVIQAMGWSGKAEYIPSLMAYFDTPEYARLSALSVITITGSLPEHDGWQRKKDGEIPPDLTPESADFPVRDPEQDVCWPDRKAFAGWWQANQNRFSPDAHYLCGQPDTQKGLNTVLEQGYLNLRQLALMRMGMLPELAALPVVNLSQPTEN